MSKRPPLRFVDHTGIEPAISSLQNLRHPIATSGPYLAAISARHLMFGAGTTKCYFFTDTAFLASSMTNSTRYLICTRFVSFRR